MFLVVADFAFVFTVTVVIFFSFLTVVFVLTLYCCSDCAGRVPSLPLSFLPM